MPQNASNHFVEAVPWFWKGQSLRSLNKTDILIRRYADTAVDMIQLELTEMHFDNDSDFIKLRQSVLGYRG
jgi:hypothetical protein